MGIKLRNYYMDSKGNMRYLDWVTKCEMLTMHCPVLSDCIGVPNIDRIYPLKQRIVRDMYTILKELPSVDEFWIFGSSTQLRCNAFSDLDVAYKVSADSDLNIEVMLAGYDPNGIDFVNLDNVPRNERLWGQIHKGAQII